MYTSNIPAYDIDLSLPEGERWSEVIEKELKAARAVAIEALEDFEQYCPPWIMNIGSWALGRMYHVFGGRYRGEIEAWADALNMHPDMITAGNCSYELSHILGEQPYGCTAGITKSNDLGLVHVRNMDWPLKSIGKATRIFNFHGGSHPFSTVGIPGHVGVLSGMVPGRYSATLNWAPPDGLPNFAFGPAFLLREVFENCCFYSDAVAALADTPMATPAFFVVCGKNQAVIIERTKNESVVHRFEDSCVQANHFRHPNMRRFNSGVDLDYSKERAGALNKALSKVELGSLDDIARALDAEPALNENTHQQMIFAPSVARMKTWRWAA